MKSDPLFDCNHSVISKMCNSVKVDLNMKETQSSKTLREETTKKLMQFFFHTLPYLSALSLVATDS